MCLSHLIHRVRPCLIHTCHAMPMPRPCHALTMSFFLRPRHSMAVERRPVGYLPAFGFFRLPRAVPRRLLSEAYHADFHEGHGTSEQGRGAAWLVWINTRHGRGTAWERHERGMGTACYVWIGLMTVMRNCELGALLASMNSMCWNFLWRQIF